jgi:hypothetical protein
VLAGPPITVVALFTRMSTPPRDVTVSSTSAATEAAEAVSTTCASTLPPRRPPVTIARFDVSSRSMTGSLLVGQRSVRSGVQRLKTGSRSPASIATVTVFWAGGSGHGANAVYGRCRFWV